MKSQRAHSRRTQFLGLTCGAVASVIAAMIIGGCGLGEWARNGAKVGPNYKPPVVAVAFNWIDYRDPRLEHANADLARWWGVFNDPVLNSLIDQAYAQNLSLRGAGERIAEARARRGIAVGNYFPQSQTAAGSYTANKASNQTANSNVSEQWYSNWEAGFNVSWELDLWGRFRRSVEAADADLQASVADFDNVLVVLLGDVAANYVQYRTFQERVAVARRNIEVQEKSYQLARDKFDAGASTERDVQQSRQVLEQTRAAIPQLEASQRQAANALCVLLGLPPHDLTARLDGPAAAAATTAPASGPTTAPAPPGIPVAPHDVAIGIPADLLRRRPDVRRFERLAAAQSALIGVAKADYYPRLSLLGSIGVQGEYFGDMFHTPGSVAGSIGPGFQWDILNYGRIESNVELQQARFRELVYAYQESVLRAGREAEDAVVGFLKAQERARLLGDSVNAAARTVEITHDQYREGVIDFTPVFLFEGTLAEQQDQLALARGEIALNLVDLYRALGGGWEMRLQGDGGGQSTTQPAATRPTIASN